MPYDFNAHYKKRYPGWMELSEQKQIEIIIFEGCRKGWWAMTKQERIAEIERINQDLEDYEEPISTDNLT